METKAVLIIITQKVRPEADLMGTVPEIPTDQNLKSLIKEDAL